MKETAAEVAPPLPISEDLVEQLMARAGGLKATWHEAQGLGKGHPKGLTAEDRAYVIDLAMLLMAVCQTIKSKLPPHKAAALDVDAVVRHGVPVIIKHMGFGGIEYLDEMMLGMVAWAVISARPDAAT